MVLYSESAAKKERDVIADFERKAQAAQLQSEPEKSLLEYNNRTWKSWVNLGFPMFSVRIEANIDNVLGISMFEFFCI